MAKSTQVVDGVRVWFDRCDHCGRTPTYEELKASVKMAVDEYRGRFCGVCGGAQKIESLDLYHYKECDQDRWGSRVTEFDTLLSFEGQGGLTVRLMIHPGCAMKAIPHIKWGFSLAAAQK